MRVLLSDITSYKAVAPTKPPLPNTWAALRRRDRVPSFPGMGGQSYTAVDNPFPHAVVVEGGIRGPYGHIWQLHIGPRETAALVGALMTDIRCWSSV